jgi:hypothetical protein
MSRFGLRATLTASLGLGLTGMLALASCLRADATYLALRAPPRAPAGASGPARGSDRLSGGLSLDCSRCAT